MSRWTAFDEAAAAAIRERGEDAINLCDAQEFDRVLSDSLQHDAPLIAVLPAREQGQAILLRIEYRARIEAVPAAQATGPRYAASGFLGLTDALDDEEPPRPKKWWQKILD